MSTREESISSREKEVGIKTKEKKNCIETEFHINLGMSLVFVSSLQKVKFYFITALFIEQNFTFYNVLLVYKNVSAHILFKSSINIEICDICEDVIFGALLFVRDN